MRPSQGREESSILSTRTKPMKTSLITSIKLILADRLLTALIVILVLTCLGYGAYVGLSLRPSDLQVAVHYTAFGGTSFYRNKWYYLITFIVFGLMVAVTHTILAVKIHQQGRRDLAVFFLGLSLLLVVIATFLTQAVLKIAFL